MDSLIPILTAATGLVVGWLIALRVTTKANTSLQDQVTKAETGQDTLRAKELSLTQALSKAESERDAARENAGKSDRLATEATERENSLREKFAELNATKISLEKELSTTGDLQRKRIEELVGDLALQKESEATTRTSLEVAHRELADSKATEARFRTESSEKDKTIAEIRTSHAQELRTLREQKDTDLAALKARQDEALKAMTESFKVLSADTLKEQLPEMLKGAEVMFQKFQATAEGDFENKQTKLNGLLAPLKESLESYRQQIRTTEESASVRIGEVKSLIETLTTANKTLADETGQFRMVLKSSQARGRWGELMLERVFEAAGMQKGIHYSVQDTSGVDKQRPDMIVKLPKGREVIIDSKVPDFDAIGELCQTDDPEKRAQLSKEFAKKLRETAKALSLRNYPASHPNALDHVILFLPAESLFAAALEGDKDIVMALAKEHILLATPASILAMIHAVLIGWRQHNQEEKAKEIAEAAGTLYERCVKLGEHWERVGKGLRTAADAYSDAVGSYNSRILPAGKELKSLGVKATKDVPELTTVEFVDKPLTLG